MKKFRDLIKEKCPNTQALIDEQKLKQPTEKERLEALENAIADIAIILAGGINNG